MILEDFVMLGTTVPEPSSDGRVFVCSAGYSREMRSLIRIYPLARRGIPRRWNTYRVPLERNPKDSRAASFRVKGDRSTTAHEHINAAFELTGAVRPADLRHDLEKYALVGSIAEANERRMSLAIIRPTSVTGVEFTHNPDSPDSPQMALFDHGPEKPTAGSKRFPFIPRVRFTDDAGEHCLQVRDWGGYEFMRKYPSVGEPRDLNYHLAPASSLLVGNLNNQRTAWIVISVLNGLRADEQPGLFDAAELLGEAS